MTDPDPIGAGASAADPAVCYRHPDREAHIRCVRCERRICPDCMIPASVGFQCPECVKAGNKGTRTARTALGGRVTPDPGWVTRILIGITVLVFVAQQTLSGFTDRFIEFAPLTASGEYYRLFTSTFMHGSILHIASNMYALYLFGPTLEAAMGRGRFLALYLISGLGGSAASYAFSPTNQPSLGASGAIFGLLGAYLVVSKRFGRDTTPVFGLLAINFVLGFVLPNIDWRAHVGGLVTGALCAVALAYAPQGKRGPVQVGGLVGTAVLVLTVVAVRTMQLR